MVLPILNSKLFVHFIESFEAIKMCTQSRPVFDFLKIREILEFGIGENVS